MVTLLVSSLAHSTLGILPPSTQSEIENEQAKRLQVIEEMKRGLNKLTDVTELPQVAIDEQDMVKILSGLFWVIMDLVNISQVM